MKISPARQRRLTHAARIRRVQLRHWYKEEKASRKRAKALRAARVARGAWKALRLFDHYGTDARRLVVTTGGRQMGKTFWGREFLGHIGPLEYSFVGKSADMALAFAGMDFGLTEARIVAQLGKVTIDKVFWDELIKKQQQNTENQK